MTSLKQATCLLCIALTLGCGPKKDASTDTQTEATASVDFLNLKDGQTVNNPFTVKFGVTGMSVAPAGAASSKNAGHHHLIVDAKPIPYGTMVPMDAQHLHFMKGESEHKLELKPGKHTLTLQFAGTDHRSFGTPLSKTINIIVKGKMTQKTAMDPHAGHHGMGASAAQNTTAKDAKGKRIFFVAPTDGQTVPP